jgi:sugar (pentulose or hexulose) kinase
MMTMMSGLVAILLGLVFLGFWWNAFIEIVKAGIPVVLILGGALAAYLGLEEYKDQKALKQAESAGPASAEAERYKAEAEKYKAELEKIKQEQGQS